MSASPVCENSETGRRPAAALGRGCAWLGLLAFAAGCGLQDLRVPNRHVTSTRPEGCADCHLNIACQWQASTHASAWTNPAFQDDTDGYSEASCLPCHAPEPLLEQPPSEAPRLRSLHLQDGIDCHACHAACGGYAGRYETFGPHIMQQDGTNLPCSDFCGRCHKTEMGEYETEYAAAVKPQTPLPCAECHMPRNVERLTQGHLLSLIHPKRPVHDHSFPLWTPVITAGAVEITELVLERRCSGQLSVQVTLVNRGAGHRIPTGEFRHSEVRILAETLDGEQRILGQAERSLLARSDDALAYGRPAVFRLDIRLPDDVVPHHVRLVVERVNADRSFRYTLVEAERLVGPQSGLD